MSVIERAVERLSRQRQALPVRLVEPVDDVVAASPGPERTAAAVDLMQADAAAAVPPSVTISLDSLRRGGLIVPGEGGYAAEQYRTIKRALLATAAENGQEKSGRIVMVTSAWPGEGKTFTAINLALSMISERDIGVVLVDGDVLKPSIPEKLGFKTDHGLLDLLADERSDLSGAVLKTNWANLDILPGGRPHPLAHELVASARMKAMIDQLVERYPDRMIIFDAPPMLATTLAGVLATYVGQVAFVVQAMSTGAADIKQAVDSLNCCKHVGVILSMMAARPGYRHYEKYYSGSDAKPRQG